MKVFKRGSKGKPININRNDFVASGGEGSVYHVSNLAFKIFHDRKKVPPEAKLNELSVIKHPNVIGPIDILMDSRNRIIGYTTKWVDGIPMCKIFVTSFRKREGIKDDHIVQLVENMKETISHVHSHDIIMVDGNELNYIVGKDFTTPYFIDTTCWQTPSFPASVIMPSIRDWTSKTFSKASDWFSFGVIACWLFTGVHPFKGKHDRYDKKFMDNVERVKQRVIDGVSIFNKNVRVAPNARMSSIPGHYKDWFIHLFEKGERHGPPSAPGSIVALSMTVKTITGTNNFKIKIIKQFDEYVLWHSKINGITITRTMTQILFKRHKIQAEADTHIVLSPIKQLPVVANINNRTLELSVVDGNVLKYTPPNATELMVVDNTLYYRDNDKLVEMQILERQDNNIFATVKSTWNIMPRSSKVFAGVVIQNMLGKIHATIPIPRQDGPSSCITKAIPELDEYRIYDAKYMNRVLAVHGQKGNDYHTLVFRFKKDHSEYDVRTIDVDDVVDINMTVLDNGVAIIIPKNGVLELFGNNPMINDIKSVQDPAISIDMRLCKDGTKAMFIRNNTIYSISMR